MNTKSYLLISAGVFALIAFLHLVRLFTHWTVQVGTLSFPLWGSWLVFLVAAVLSVWAFRLMSRWKRSHLS
jgi:hypothetical protein